MQIFTNGPRHTALVALSYRQLALIVDMLDLFQPADDTEEVRFHELREQLTAKRDALAPETIEVAA